MFLEMVLDTLETMSDRERLVVICAAAKKICRDFSATGEPCSYKCPLGGFSRCKEIHKLADRLCEQIKKENGIEDKEES